jgi:hypothetical protein
MKKIILIALMAFHGSAAAQSIQVDKRVVPGYVYSYEKDGMRHYSSKPPEFIAYRAIPYSLIETTGLNRINGLPCESDCVTEARGYREARDRGISDSKDCPSEPASEVLGCRLWVMEAGGK